MKKGKCGKRRLQWKENRKNIIQGQMWKRTEEYDNVKANGIYFTHEKTI